MVQGKTGEEAIPEHHELTAEPSPGVAGHISLLTTMQGKAFDPVYFGAWFADAIEAAGLPDDCGLHGLRKTAARLLVEAGCSKEEIKAIAQRADPNESDDRRMSAAMAAAPYCHRKLKAIERSGPEEKPVE